MAIRRNKLNGAAGTALTMENIALYGDPITAFGGTGTFVYASGGGVDITPSSTAQTYLQANEDQAGTRFVCAERFRVPTETLTAETGVLSIVSGTSGRGRILLPSTLRPRLAVGSTGVTATQMADPLTAGAEYLAELAYSPDPGGTTGGLQFRISALDGTLLHQCAVQAHALTGSPNYRFGTASNSQGLTTQRVREIQWGPLASGWIGPFVELPVISLGPDRSALAGETVTVTATVTGATSATFEQIGGPSVGTITPVGQLSATFRAPVGLTGATITIRATATNSSGPATDTIALTIGAAPVSLWDGTTNRPATIDVKV